MTIVNRDKCRRPQIDLGGPDGNAFCLLGTARSLARQLGWEKTKTDAVAAEMRSGDYKNLVAVFDREFGDLVDLILPEGGL